MPEQSAEFEIWKQTGNDRESVTDHVACEEPLQITVDGTPIAVVMRTPGHDEDLVNGFLLTEGMVTSLADVTRVDLEAQKNHAYVFLADDVVIDHARFSRNLFSASSCGICGKASIDAIQQDVPPVEDGFSIPASVVFGLPDILCAGQEVFASGWLQGETRGGQRRVGHRAGEGCRY